MSDEQGNKNIGDGVLDAIKHGRIKMRPRWHFILKGVLLSLGILLAFLFILYLMSFALFTMQQGGGWFAPVFGMQGWFIFMRSLPLLLIFVAGIFIVVLEMLVNRYSFAYRKPLLYSATGILALVLLGGICMAPMHRGLFRSARENRLPMMGGFYKNFGPREPQDIHRCQVTALTENGFLAEDIFGGTSTVVISSQTRLPYGAEFESGDTVVVFGKKAEDGTIPAFGIREIGESDLDSGFRRERPFFPPAPLP
ncbi:MAG: hypothetical protein V1856_02105 [Candidatus Liptonbacteria bacterium]